MMRILFDDDHGQRIALQCSSFAATRDPDSDKWVVIANEMGNERGVIVRTGLTESEAKSLVHHLFDTGRSVQCP